MFRKDLDLRGPIEAGWTGEAVRQVKVNRYCMYVRFFSFKLNLILCQANLSKD